MNSRLCLIGGGFSGILMASILRGKNVVGIEGEEQLGGRLHRNGHQIRGEETLRWMNSIYPELRWNRGYQGRIGEKSIVEYWYPEGGYSSLRAAIEARDGEIFALGKPVVSLDKDRGWVMLQGGGQVEFDRLVWCGTQAELESATPGQQAPLEAKHLSAIQLEVCAPEVELEGPLGFEMKFKGEVFSLTGWFAGGGWYAWIAQTTEEVAASPEETAKLITAYAREIGKRFPALEGVLKKDKRVFAIEEDTVVRSVDDFAIGDSKLILGRPAPSVFEDLFVLDSTVLGVQAIAQKATQAELEAN